MMYLSTSWHLIAAYYMGIKIPGVASVSISILSKSAHLDFGEMIDYTSCKDLGIEANVTFTLCGNLLGLSGTEEGTMWCNSTYRSSLVEYVYHNDPTNSYGCLSPTNLTLEISGGAFVEVEATGYNYVRINASSRYTFIQHFPTSSVLAYSKEWEDEYAASTGLWWPLRGEVQRYRIAWEFTTFTPLIIKIQHNTDPAGSYLCGAVPHSCECLWDMAYKTVYAPMANWVRVSYGEECTPDYATPPPAPLNHATPNSITIMPTINTGNTAVQPTPADEGDSPLGTAPPSLISTVAQDKEDGIQDTAGPSKLTVVLVGSVSACVILILTSATVLLLRAYIKHKRCTIVQAVAIDSVGHLSNSVDNGGNAWGTPGRSENSMTNADAGFEPAVDDGGLHSTGVQFPPTDKLPQFKDQVRHYRVAI